MKTLIPKASPKLTRYAPTPSGFLHIGNVYSFVITAILAKRSASKIFLRIDDMDKERCKDKYIVDILETLNFLELPFDIGPQNLTDFKKNFSQYSRLDLYQKYLKDLKEQGILFACDCSRNKIQEINPKGYYSGFCKNRELSFEEPNIAWRIDTSPQGEISFLDWEGNKHMDRIPGILRDFVVRKKDGTPSYQLCSIADDIYYGVDSIVRGNDLLGSTLAQVFLSKFVNTGFEAIRFYHHPLIKGPDFKKLSKSAGATSIQAMRKSGKRKEDVYTLLGHILGKEKVFKSWEDFDIGEPE